MTQDLSDAKSLELETRGWEVVLRRSSGQNRTSCVTEAKRGLLLLREAFRVPQLRRREIPMLVVHVSPTLSSPIAVSMSMNNKRAQSE